MGKNKVRVRFAPSPTGMMHLGNVRTALMNYLFAKQKNGTFVLRIEDTDPERNFDPKAEKIIEDLTWLGLHYDEGPQVGGPFAPYFQSQRIDIYKKNLDTLIKGKKVYRCFCTTEELEKKRQRQIALKMPPRYDRTCKKLTDEEIQNKLDANTPYIWRFEFDQDKKITIHDITHGDITFDLKNFSDFPLTRQNGTFTFMFANFVDDMTMQITHVFRGEDHLSNTAGQAALYHAFNKELPLFWHMPILCNIEGRKLSKRDFGFAIRDLRKSGYVPEAICNYLAIIGGSFEQEIMSIQELVKALEFEKNHAKGQIKYDVEKLRWINHKWIDQYDNKKLTETCLPFLLQDYPETTKINKQKLQHIIEILKPGLVTLQDITHEMQFYFVAPKVKKIEVLAVENEQTIAKVTPLIEKHIELIEQPEQFISTLKNECKANNIKIKDMFSLVRIGLIGKSKGPGIGELLNILDIQESKKRLKTLFAELKN